VRPLVDAGLVVQEADPQDGRATLLVTTLAGRRAFERYRNAAGAILAESLHDWTDRDLHRLAGLLARILAESLE
jgi:DNA-binding MarR family transcriptional regulator